MKLSHGFPKRGLLKAIRHRPSVPLLQVMVASGSMKHEQYKLLVRDVGKARRIQWDNTTWSVRVLVLEGL